MNNSVLSNILIAFISILLFFVSYESSKCLCFAFYLFLLFYKKINSSKSLIVPIAITFNFLTVTKIIPTLVGAGEVRSIIPKPQQPSSYKLTSSSSSYAQYSPWYPCLSGSLIFEFQTHEPNALLVYTQALPYKYIQINLIDGHLRMRMRIGEKDDPRGIILSYEKTRLNDQKWHEIKLTRQNEQTILTIDRKETLYHVHKDANLEGFDLYFGSHSNDHNLPTTQNLLVFGGIPNYFQTYDLSLGTALFEHRYNGYIRNVRALNCTAQHMQTLYVTENNNLRYVNDFDACMSSPCFNNGVCLLTDEMDGYMCDCRHSSYEGKNCDHSKFYL